MKKILLLIVLFTFCNVNAQQKTTEVYKTENGIRSLTPSQVIQTNGNTTNVYNTTNGIKELTPSKIIEKTNNTIQVYNTTNGIRNLTPSSIIITKEK